MYLTVLIVLFFLWRLLLNYNRGVLLMTAWVLVLDILNLPGGRITAFQLLAFLSCAIGLYRYLSNKRRDISYPFWGCAIAVTLSIIVTNLFSPEHRWLTCIKNIIVPCYVFPFCVWNAMQKTSNMRFFVKYTVIFLVLLVVYGLYEVITSSNPIMEWIQTNDLAVASVGLSDRDRYGLKRIQSFLAYNGALGTCCIINALFIMFVNMQYKIYIRTFSRIIPVLVIGLYLCALFTGSRSIIAASLVGSLYFVRGNILKFKWTWILIIAAVLVVPFVLPYFEEIIHTFADTESAGGSSTTLREGQFDLAYYFFSKSPWYGNGYGFTFAYVVENFRSEMLGAESIWFPLMIERGIIGVVAYLIVLYLPFKYCLAIKNRVGVFIILAFITAKTLSSIPGVSEAYFLIYVIATSRLILYQQEQNIYPSYREPIIT